jgi:hypothetical protein
MTGAGRARLLFTAIVASLVLLGPAAASRRGTRCATAGRLARGLDEAPSRGWIVTSMKRDWKTVFPATSSK